MISLYPIKKINVVLGYRKDRQSLLQVPLDEIKCHKPYTHKDKTSPIYRNLLAQLPYCEGVLSLKNVLHVCP